MSTDKNRTNPALEALRRNVTGRIEAGEAEAIVEIPAENRGAVVTFTKVERGWYATPDGTMAVTRDGTGYVTISEREGSGVLTGCDDDGWSLSVDKLGRLRSDRDAGETLGWFDTKRDAINAAQREQS